VNFLFCIDAYGDEILQTVKIRAEIKKLALTLYLGESDLVSLVKLFVFKTEKIFFHVCEIYMDDFDVFFFNNI